MPEYQCPQCNGGFPDPKPTESSPECPWCGTELDGQYGQLTIGFDGREKLKETINTTGRDIDIDTDLGSGNTGTTTCPECGDEMPMTTWAGPKPTCRTCRMNEGNPIFQTTHTGDSE